MKRFISKSSSFSVCECVRVSTNLRRKLQYFALYRVRRPRAYSHIHTNTHTSTHTRDSVQLVRASRARPAHRKVSSSASDCCYYCSTPPPPPSYYLLGRRVVRCNGLCLYVSSHGTKLSSQTLSSSVPREQNQQNELGNRAMGMFIVCIVCVYIVHIMRGKKIRSRVLMCCSANGR